MTVSRFLVLLAVICFVLAALGVAVGSVDLIPTGLALWAGSSLT